MHKFGKFPNLGEDLVGTSGMLPGRSAGWIVCFCEKFFRGSENTCNRKFLSRLTPIGLRTKEFEALVGSIEVGCRNFDNLFKFRNDCRKLSAPWLFICRSAPSLMGLRSQNIRSGILSNQRTPFLTLWNKDVGNCLNHLRVVFSLTCGGKRIIMKAPW